MLNHPIPVAVVAVAGTSSSAVLAMIELLSAVGRPWQFGQQQSRAIFAPYVIATADTQVAVPVGIDRFSLDNVNGPEPAIVFIPEIRLDLNPQLPTPDWNVWREPLRSWHRHGAVMCSASSGVALLAQSGLLDDRPANSHWALTRELQRRYPAVQFSGREALVAGDAGGSILTAGAGSAWADLALHLIARFVGRDMALQMARIEMLQWHEFGQRPYREPINTAEFADGAIGQALNWLHENFARAAPVGAAVEHAGLPERTFTRRFHVATGASPLEYVHHLRLNQARRLLESTSLNIQSVAAELGYEDPSFFSRLFKREVGLTPAQYRKRFSPMRDALPVGPERAPA